MPEDSRKVTGGTGEKKERERQASTVVTEKTQPGAKGLLEEVLRRENMLSAFRRVRSNKGASGIDGMTVEELGGYLKTEWVRIREELLKGTYEPAPVKRVEIPKPNGKNNGGEVTYFDQEDRVELTVKDPHVFRTISVPRSVVECDLLVNVPKMKTSFMTEVTLGIKNLYGCITYEQRKRFHREIDLSYVLADIANTLTPGLTIIDGIVAMDGWGPHAGNTVDMGVIIGGSDIVAVDAVGSSIMGLDPRAAPTTQVAERDGLGTASLSDITILGEKIEDVRKILARPVFKFVTKAPNVRLFPGGPCPGCRGRIPLVPLEVDPNKKYGIIVGREPVALPEVMDVDEIWLLGNCGLRAGMAYVLRDMVRAAGKGSSWKPSVKVVPGCPPLDYYSEQTCFTGLRQKGWMKRDPIVEDGRYR